MCPVYGAGFGSHLVPTTYAIISEEAAQVARNSIIEQHGSRDERKFHPGGALHVIRLTVTGIIVN